MRAALVSVLLVALVCGAAAVRPARREGGPIIPPGPADFVGESSVEDVTLVNLQEGEELRAPPTWWNPWDSVDMAEAGNGTEAGGTANGSAAHTETPVVTSGPTADAANLTVTADMTDQDKQKVALMQLYESTGGARWAKNGGWLGTEDHCTWLGVTCNSQRFVTRLELSFNRLIGALPGAAMGALNTLRNLDLSKNYITGSVPPELGNLSELRELVLHNNHFMGGVPPTLLALSKLTLLDLHNNMLAGNIPDSIGALTELRYLYLHSNELEGAVPPSIKSLSKVRELDLSQNRLTGSIPSEISGMVELEDMSMSENQLTGSIPAEGVATMLKLVYLRLNDNKLTGAIPVLTNNKDVAQIDLSHNQLSGTIPEFGGPEGLPQLVLLDLSYNQLTGPIPTTLAMSKRIRRLNFSYNKLGGSLPSTMDLMHDLTEVYLDHNQIEGRIPEVMGTQLRHILFLNLSNNKLSGPIPASLKEIHKLRVLNLSSNRLEGDLPEALSELGSVRSINLENNHLTGRLSEAFGKMPTLEVLKLAGNDMASRSHFLPSFIRRDNSVMVSNDTGHFVCTALRGEDTTNLVTVTLDPAYHNYHQCICANDWFGDPPHCAPCPYHAHCVNGEVICDPDYFSYPEEPAVCLDCPEGAECPGGSRIFPKEGYWRSNATTLSFWECPNGDSCLGGEDSLCDVGYEGPMCAVCEVGFFSRGVYRCDQCPNQGMMLFYVVTFVVLGALFFIMLLRVRTIFWMAKLKILLGFFQMIAVLDLAYDAHWPRAFLEYLWVFSFMSTDFIQVTILDCPSILNPLHLHFDYYFSLLLVVGAPILAISCILGYWIIRSLWRCLFPTDPRFDSIWFKRFFERIKRWIWLVLLFVYPGVTGKLFRYFKCRKLENGEWWLKTDYATHCYDMKYWEYSSVAFAGLLLYTVLVPLLMFVTFAWNYKRLQTEEFVKIHLGPLYLDYKPGYWWWEFVDLGRKVLLGSVVVFFVDKKETQFTCALIISLVFLLAHLVLRPYRVDHDHWYMFCVHLALHIAFMLGLAVVVKANLVVTTLAAFGLLGFFSAIILMPILFFLFRHMCARTYDSEALEEYYGKVLRSNKQYAYAIVTGRAPNYPQWVVGDETARHGPAAAGPSASAADE